MVKHLDPHDDPLAIDALRRRLAAAQRENARLRVLVHASAAIANARLDLPAVLDTIAARVASDIGDWCLIRLVSDDGAWLDTVAARHHDAEADAFLRTLAMEVHHPVGQGLQGQVIATGQPLLVATISPEAFPPETRRAYAAWYDRYGASSLLIVPLRLADRVIGTLGLMRDAGGTAYTEADRDLALALADHAAQAIDTSRLYQQTQVAEAWLRGVLNGVADAVMITDEAGNYIDVNPAASALFGYSEAELRQLRVGDLSPTRPAAPDWAWQEFRRLVGDGQWRGEAQMRRKDGTLVPIEAVVTGVRLPDGSMVYVGSNRDISERQRLAQLQQDFIRMVSHDLRSPLTSIRGLAQLMRRRGQYNADYLTHIVAQADRMQSLLTDLFDIERIERGQFPLSPEPVDLVTVVRACVNWAAAHASQHDVRLDVPDGAVRGWWDRGRLEQVCENLLSNALKYTPDGGQIRVVVRSTGDRAVIEVCDTGLGIPVEALPHLFERFYRVDRDGSQSPSGIGLGLYIAKMLVDAMDGKIGVASEVGRGSTFTVTLPIRSEPVVSQHDAATPTSEHRSPSGSDAGCVMDDGDDPLS